MLGLFGTLDMGARSLSVEQEEMAVTGQNLANVNNTAYADETLDISESTPLETTLGMEGTGVQATSISEARNPLLDGQIQAETSATGSLSAQQSNLQNAEAYLDEQISSSTSSTVAGSANGLAADLTNLFDSFQSLSTDPSNLSLRQTAVQSAQEVAAQFNQVSALPQPSPRRLLRRRGAQRIKSDHTRGSSRSRPTKRRITHEGKNEGRTKKRASEPPNRKS